MILKVSSFDDVLEMLNPEDKEIPLLFMDNSPKSEFEKFFAQELIRKIDGVEHSFFAIRTMTLKEDLRGHGKFKDFLCSLSKIDYPVMFHDVINPRLLNLLLSSGYSVLLEEKYGEKISSCYRLIKES